MWMRQNPALQCHANLHKERDVVFQPAQLQGQSRQKGSAPVTTVACAASQAPGHLEVHALWLQLAYGECSQWPFGQDRAQRLVRRTLTERSTEEHCH